MRHKIASMVSLVSGTRSVPFYRAITSLPVPMQTPFVSSLLARNANKAIIEMELQKKAGDVVVHSAVDGITDIAFENRREGKTVSVYFTGDEKGKKLYQDWAARFAKDTGIELVNEFSHTGLARISMSWNRYWQQTEKQETKQIER